MDNYDKPLPEITAANRGFWEAARKGELHLQTCASCGHVRYPVADVCPECLSEDHGWTRMSGRGEVFSYVVFHQVYHPAYRNEVPYNVAMIQLAEGPRMISNIVGTVGPVDAGTPVEVTFDAVTDAVTIPRFRLSEA